MPIRSSGFCHLAATLQTAGLAMLIAIPFGLTMAIYLSEYAPDAVRETIKPALEMLEAVPTVVYGYFALLVMTPFLQQFVPGLKGINLLVPGIILGIMILPYVVSVSEDAMRAVPDSLREGGYALGMARWQVATRIVIPARFPASPPRSSSACRAPWARRWCWRSRRARTRT